MGSVKICYAKELTKIYEFIETKDVKTITEEIKNRPELTKGELTVIVDPSPIAETNQELS
jgi:16S rRNA C1402 (ribose-2'-O) methylase RsmI